MKILLDCDVLLDQLLQRQPFLVNAARVFNACETGEIRGAIAWHTLSNAYYLANDNKKSLAFFEDSLSFIEVIGGDTELALAAIRSGFTDFEDALQSVCAQKFGADFIVTRNVKDYRLSKVKAILPKEFVAKFLDE